MNPNKREASLWWHYADWHIWPSCKCCSPTHLSTSGCGCQRHSSP